MTSISTRERSAAADAIYGLLNPIPFGCFVAALVFDVVYSRSGQLMWEKSAAWLLVLGLLGAIVPRLINLVQVWITHRRHASRAERLDFWINLLAIVAAIVNSFVHSRDAYGVVPDGVWLSAATVILLCIGHLLLSMQRANSGIHLHA